MKNVGDLFFRLAVDLSELMGIVSHGVSTLSTVTTAERNRVEKAVRENVCQSWVSCRSVPVHPASALGP